MTEWGIIGCAAQQLNSPRKIPCLEHIFCRQDGLLPRGEERKSYLSPRGSSLKSTQDGFEIIYFEEPPQLDQQLAPRVRRQMDDFKIGVY